MNSLELMPVQNLDSLWQVVGIARCDEANFFRLLTWRDVPQEHVVARGKPHIEVMVAREIYDPPTVSFEKVPYCVYESRMPFETAAQFFSRDLGGDLEWPLVFDLDFEKVEDVPIENKFNVGLIAAQGIVVVDEFREAVVVDEVLERIELSTANPSGQMEVTDDDPDHAHGESVLIFSKDFVMTVALLGIRLLNLMLARLDRDSARPLGKLQRVPTLRGGRRWSYGVVWSYGFTQAFATFYLNLHVRPRRMFGSG